MTQEEAETLLANARITKISVSPRRNIPIVRIAEDMWIVCGDIDAQGNATETSHHPTWEEARNIADHMWRAGLARIPR